MKSAAPYAIPANFTSQNLGIAGRNLLVRRRNSAFQHRKIDFIIQNTNANYLIYMVL
jgi:hypothetical protein